MYIYIYIYCWRSLCAAPIRYRTVNVAIPSHQIQRRLVVRSSYGSEHDHEPAGRFSHGGGRARARLICVHVNNSSPNGRRYCKMTCSSVRTAYHVSQDCTMIRRTSACPCGMLLAPPTSRAMSCQGCRDSLFAPLLISAYNNDHRNFARSNGQFKSEGLILD